MNAKYNSIIGRSFAIVSFVFILIVPICIANAGSCWDIVKKGSKDSIDNRGYGALDAATLAHAGLIEINLTRLTDKQLNQIRGGIGKFSFGISFAGIFDKLGNLTGQIFSSNDSVSQEVIESTISNISSNDTQTDATSMASEAATSTTTPQTAITNSAASTANSNTTPQVTSIQTAEVDGAAISAYVGNFDGATGIFQISQSPGSYNVITNNMTINISIYNFSSESQASKLLSNF